MKFDENDIERRNAALENEPQLFAWKTITLATHGGNKGVWKKKLMVVLSPSIATLVILFGTDFHIIGVLFALFFQIFCGFWVYYLTPNSSIEYQLSRLGIKQFRYEVFPKNTFSILRGFAWFGVAVCIFSVLFMGPLALVGAGGLALMSFKFKGIGVEEKKRYKKYLFDDEMIFFNILDNNCVEMISSPVEDVCEATLYFNNEDRELVLENIKKILPNSHFIDLKTENDIYQHELFKSALAEGRRLYEEQQSKEYT